MLIWVCIFFWYINPNGLVSYCAKIIRQATHYPDSASCVEGTLLNCPISLDWMANGCIYQILSWKAEINNKRLQFSVLFGVKLKVRRTKHRGLSTNLSLKIYSIQLHKHNCDSLSISEGNMHSIPTVHIPWTLYGWWEFQYTQAAKCKCAITATCCWLISHPKVYSL